ncbi:MAG: DUF3348 domain-containing protein [Herminiimonas sp.]|nr:DUF3348 domain-containing protein [Herminiimonas sp.]
MSRVLPRTNFHSSKLIRCLADLAMVDPGEAGNAFAEKLGSWVHFADAIALSGVHDGMPRGSPDLWPTVAVAGLAARVEFDRTQTGLIDAIVKSCLPNAGKPDMKLRMPTSEAPIDRGAYVAYRRFYETHQRDMELTIASLRVKVRNALGRSSRDLKQLADLDAAFEKILRERESKLLAKVPVLLGKRFEKLYSAHQQKLADAQQTDDPAGWTQAGGWLARFCNDMQVLLLAELELRLQPTMGLVEAFTQETP